MVFLATGARRFIPSPESWRGRDGFAQFLADMGPRPSEAHTIDRLGLHYGPGSCRWATVPEQNRNKSNNHMLTIGNRTMPLVDWAAAVGLSDKKRHFAQRR
jgi:hypothetical protein